MGDVIHALPAITDAHKNIHDLQVDFLVDESFAEIPSWHSGVSQVLTVANRRWRQSFFQSLGEIRAVYRQLRSAKYDVIIDLQGLGKSAIYCKLLSGVRHGYDKRSIREPFATCFYDVRHPVSKKIHAIDRVRTLTAKALNYSTSLAQLDYGIAELKINDNSENSAGITNPYWVFLHGTTWLAKQWPIDSWIKLADLAHEHNRRVMLPWGNTEEKVRAQTIAGSVSGSNIEVLPKSNLTELYEILAASEGVVAVDTGLGHLSAALSRPTVTIYGPTDIQLIGTKGDCQAHLCATIAKKNNQKRTELKSKLPYDYGSVTPDLVFSKLSSLIEGKNV